MVTNQQFEEALKNKDNVRLINFITNKYAKKLDKDIRRECGLIALWRALKKYDPKFGQKFTSSLYRFIHWECRRELAKRDQEDYQIKGNRRRVRDEFVDIDNKEFVEHYLDLLPAEDREIIRMHYLEDVSVTNIADKFGWQKEVVRKRIKASMLMLQELVE